MKNRREFLKKSAIALGTASLLGGASVAFGQDQDEERKDLVRGKAKRRKCFIKEVLIGKNII